MENRSPLVWSWKYVYLILHMYNQIYMKTWSCKIEFTFSSTSPRFKWVVIYLALIQFTLIPNLTQPPCKQTLTSRGTSCTPTVGGSRVHPNDQGSRVHPNGWGSRAWPGWGGGGGAWALPSWLALCARSLHTFRICLTLIFNITWQFVHVILIIHM